ncbi:dihydroxyacetone kinase [Culex quinquefasciatus]|uniref:Triokinase/FMN cyclase n=1 Tax=Culex quinquefasciatus TaxID=7176 RepID=B0XBA4_CULQU|nr:dihydroxyacetone kinase [Culex quinquefasciatus]|eukprot:XP_001866926.1 dihydroxyacetone kinase [Culex quinquefasciatus]
MNSNVNIALSGFIRANNGLRLIQDRNCIVRHTRSGSSATTGVKLISGGGSGHEPAHIGYVGRGMLHGAVCGDVFAAPSATAILDCLRTVATDPGGDSVLFVVNNYTGDRLNFGLAMERARSLYGYCRVRMLLNDDDCSIEDSMVARSVGKRGLAGSVLLIKVLGAMAELGFSLDELYEYGDGLLRKGHMATFGFTFEMTDGDKLRNVELGKGLHGEPGVYKMDECDGFESIVWFMMERMVKKVPEFAEVVVLVNNLGGTSEIVVGVFLDVLTKLLETRYRIRRIYCGTYFSSLSQVGLSVTLLNLAYNEQLLVYLDHEVQVASKLFGSGQSFHLEPSDRVKFDTIVEVETRPNPDLFKIKLQESSTSLVNNTLHHIAQVLQTSRDLLNAFDRECGDGDTGNTIANGATALLAALATASIDLLHPAKMLQDISTILQLSIGGTSGAIYSLFFQAASKAFQTSTTNRVTAVTLNHWLTALAAGNDAIVQYALTELGDRTMLDPLRQGEFRLRTAVQQGLPAMDCVEIFAAACGEAAKDTQHMRPRSGRATYSASAGDGSVDYRFPDPGAHAVSIWARSLFEAFTIFFNK